MKRRTRWALGAALLAVAVGLTVPAFVGAKPDLSATVRFSNRRSAVRFSRRVRPRRVVHGGGHSDPADVGDLGGRQRDVRHRRIPSGDDLWAGNDARRHRRAAVPPESNILINEDEGLLASSPIPFGGFQGPWTPDSDTFEEPGRYLVLCNVTPHVVFGKMYGWVNVK